MNHKDEDKANNTVENLEWCNKSYNITYGSRKVSNVLSSSIPVSQYDLNGNWIKDWNSSKEAIKYFGGNSFSSICNCLRGRSKSSFGYIWQYKKYEEDN